MSWAPFGEKPSDWDQDLTGPQDAVSFSYSMAYEVSTGNFFSQFYHGQG